jgi:hypothetical protein
LFPINSRGQSFSLDLLIALSIFALVFSFIFFIYIGLFNSSGLIDEKISMERKTFNAIELITNSKGFPENWNEINLTEINSIGLLNNELIISEEKLTAFNFLINSDYELLKEKIGLQGFEFFFSFNGIDVFEAGIPLNADLDSIVLTRIVAYKGGEAIVKLTVYEI